MMYWIVIFIFFHCVSLYTVETSIFSGVAYNQANELLFTEEYLIQKENNKILSVTTKFLSPQGTLIAEMSSQFPQEQSPQDPYLPEVTFAKPSAEMSYGTTLLKQSIELFKSTSSQLLKRKKISLKENMVVGHGFYFYILDKLDQLLAGNKLQMVFLQPNRLSAYTFNMKAHVDSKQTDIVHVSLSIDNPLLKPFIPDISLSINAASKALISYEGLSGFLCDDHSLTKISVRYTSPVTLTGKQ